MALKVEHDLHRRRASRNLGLLAVLLLFAAIVFGLTIAKVKRGDNMGAWDNHIDPRLEPPVATQPAAPAPAQSTVGGTTP